MKRKISTPSFFLILYVLAVLYITLFSRSRSLMSVVHLELLWSYRRWFKYGWYYAGQVLLNIGLFIPLGYLISAEIDRRFSGRKRMEILITFFLCILLSVGIEIIQWYSGRGSLDIDDVFNNGIGAIIGTVAFVLLRDRVPVALLSMFLAVFGFIGCFLIQPNNRDYDAQFYFDIDHIEVGDHLVFSGCCTSNGARTPDYTLLLRDLKSDVEFTTDVMVNGDYYTATANVPDGKYEILVHFKTFPVISTETYISGDKVEYVAGEIAEPDCAHGILKAYSKEYDTFIYQDEGKIIWYIGYEIEPTTEVIYHIYTNKSELLPTNRVEYGFDNRGFRPGGNNELGREDGYRVFEKTIPTEYPVTSITVGFNPGNGVTWRKSFRITE